MRKHIAALMVITSMVMASAVSAQDFEKGQQAYNSGDYAAALVELKFLAERGHTGAQILLGWMCAEGKGVAQDHKEAVAWFRKAAEQGDVTGINTLAFMYYTGQGVEKSYKEAVNLYRKAAEQGSGVALDNLGHAYENGEGVIQNYVYAHMWYNIAVSEGYENLTKRRDVLTNKMSAADVSKAQELARECVKKQYKGC